MRIAQASLGLGLCLLASAAPGQAQTPPATPTTPAPPPTATPPPTGTPAPAETPGTPPGAVGHALGLEEAIGIALQPQPLIQARLSDYLAAAHRVDQAFSPLLPQLTGALRGAPTERSAQR